MRFRSLFLLAATYCFGTIGDMGGAKVAHPSMDSCAMGMLHGSG